jgi:hypothetical protein
MMSYIMSLEALVLSHDDDNIHNKGLIFPVYVAMLYGVYADREGVMGLSRVK